MVYMLGVLVCLLEYVPCLYCNLLDCFPRFQLNILFDGLQSITSVVYTELFIVLFSEWRGVDNTKGTFMRSRHHLEVEWPGWSPLSYLPTLLLLCPEINGETQKFQVGKFHENYLKNKKHFMKKPIYHWL